MNTSSILYQYFFIVNYLQCNKMRKKMFALSRLQGMKCSCNSTISEYLNLTRGHNSLILAGFVSIQELVCLAQKTKLNELIILYSYPAIHIASFEGVITMILFFYLVINMSRGKLYCIQIYNKADHILGSVKAFRQSLHPNHIHIYNRCRNVRCGM